MSERQERLQNRLQPEIREFRDGCRTLQLATVDGEGNPNASYAPFVLQEDGYYVLISEIARHARNLQQVPKVSLMLIEDETGARELFARKRLTFDAVAEVVARDDERWGKAIAALEGRFGDIVKGLSNLKVRRHRQRALQPQGLRAVSPQARAGSVRQGLRPGVPGFR